MRRVVITGVGAVTPVGCGKEKFWNAIKSGVCGINTVSKFDTENFSCKVAGELTDFEITDYIEKKEARKMDEFTQYAVAAAKMAISDSGIDFEKTDMDRVGVILGCGIGGIKTFEDQHSNFLNKGPGRVSPFFIPMMIPNIASGQIAIMTGARGVNHVVVSACASGTNAIGEAFRTIQYGDLDVAFTGGCEATISEMAFAGFCNMKALSSNPDPKTACRPFDADRDGFIMGEGAGILLLEELEHAKARGAFILAEVAGYGASDDAYHITAPIEGGAGGALSMRNAIRDAGIQPEDIGYINAHGTSTPYNDKFETQAIKDVFGGAAYKIPCSSTKSMTGHMLGAAGGVEGIICALGLAEGYIPATINYQTPDPDCDLDYVPNEGRQADYKYALSNSFGFGGHNATIILKKYE